MSVAVERPLQMALIAGHERPVGRIPGSVFTGRLNDELIEEIAPLYLTGSVLDVTYGRGFWWRRFRPEPFSYHDLAVDGVDFRQLPEADRSWDSVCFDPPYVPRSGSDTEPARRRRRELVFRTSYGLSEPRNEEQLRSLIFGGLAECARVARRWVLVKCNDYCNGKQFRLMHVAVLQEAERLGLRCHDLVIHAAGSGPGGQQILTIKRCRRAHSYLLVFSVPRRRA